MLYIYNELLYILYACIPEIYLVLVIIEHHRNCVRKGVRKGVHKKVFVNTRPGHVTMARALAETRHLNCAREGVR